MYWADEVPIKLLLFLPPSELSLVAYQIVWKCSLLPDSCVGFAQSKVKMNFMDTDWRPWGRRNTHDCHVSWAVK